MQKSMMAGILICGLASGSAWSAPNRADEVAQLKQQVNQLEQRVQHLEQLLEPLKSQQAAENRRKVMREQFDKKMEQDRKRYSAEQLQEAERLYQVANQKWGTTEATESLQTMIEKYPDINRTGCATLYVAQKAEGDLRKKYLLDCIEKFNGCFYGDGVQVGVYARYLLALEYRNQGETGKAKQLFDEIRSKYPDAVDHSGKLLVENIKGLPN